MCAFALSTWTLRALVVLCASSTRMMRAMGFFGLLGAPSTVKNITPQKHEITAINYQRNNLIIWEKKRCEERNKHTCKIHGTIISCLDSMVRHSLRFLGGFSRFPEHEANHTLGGSHDSYQKSIRKLFIWSLKSNLWWKSLKNVWHSIGYDWQ